MANINSSTPAHTVRFEISQFGAEAVFYCYARPGDPFCRMTCPVRYCEGGVDCRAEGHQLQDYGKCMFVEWMESEGGIDAFSGDKTALRGGHIVPEWCGDHWCWNYATPGGRIPDALEVPDGRA